MLMVAVGHAVGVRGGDSADPPGPTATPFTGRIVADPWKPGMVQYGINVFWSHSTDETDAVVKMRSARVLDYVVGMGANSVTLSFPFFMDGWQASTVKTTDETPSAQQIAVFLDEAAKRHLRTTLRPLLSEVSLKPLWRGLIAPANRATWFASYQSFLLLYASLAESAHVATYVVGAELSSIAADRHWTPLVAAVAQVYKGELGYSANHDQLTAPLPTKGLVKSVDAYHPLKLPDTASVEQLVSGWNKWLNATTDLNHLVLAEVGIGGQSGAYSEPYNSIQKGPLKPQLQQRWFEAACQVVRTRKLAGIYFWVIYFGFDPATYVPRGPTPFIGRPAEQTISACFGQT
jgi:hypothetical protein